MLQDCQMHLLRYMCSYPCLEYDSCLEILDLYLQTGNRTALSYAFRPLTKNGYLSKGKDGLVTICAKGRALFPDISPLVTVGGTTRERVAQVSRVALLLAKNDITSVNECRDDLDRYFIPSACWRKIAPGILSTTRFAGMLLMDNKRYAVYDIGDGHMEWQVRAESSLFYTKYGNYDTRATGMTTMPGLRWLKTSSGRPCGTGNSFSRNAIRNETSRRAGLGRPSSSGGSISMCI